MNGAEIPPPDPDLARQRRVVDAFYAAARAGDFDTLVQVLDPDVVLRADFGPTRPPAVIRGVPAVAKLACAPRSAQLHPVLVNGAVGAVITLNGRSFSALDFTVVNDKIVEINGIRDPDRVRRLAPPSSARRSEHDAERIRQPRSVDDQRCPSSRWRSQTVTYLTEDPSSRFYVKTKERIDGLLRPSVTSRNRRGS